MNFFRNGKAAIRIRLRLPYLQGCKNIVGRQNRNNLALLHIINL